MDPVSLAIEGAASAARVAETVGAGAAVATEAVPVGATLIKSAETATLVPNPIAASEISVLAKRATASVDTHAGERAIEDLVGLPDNLGETREAIPIASDEVPRMQVETGLENWQRENPRPDPTTNPEGYRQWCEQYENAEVEHIATTRTELTMQGWDKENLAPDKTKNPEEYTRWQSRRSEMQSRVKEQTTKEARNMKELEKTDVLAKINRLRSDIVERNDIVHGIDAIKKKPEEEQTDQNKIDLAKFRIRKSELDNEIRMLEADLKAQAGRASPLVALMIATALASAPIYTIGKQEGVF
ncbi:hypothetical protein HY358_01815 [Candidatus Roizmanbacteria bacterium]|nr:hypothetical protein [Candidatus Roizmanbacteria bacterium]